MKYIKIVLLISGIALIGYVGFTLISPNQSEIEDINLTDNKFVNEVNQLIEDLKNSSKSSFSKEKYTTIAYYINEYEANKKINAQWSNNLKIKLENVYAIKFIKEANYIFEQNNWKKEDVLFIRNEVNRLNKSSFFEDRQMFSAIKNILSEYDKVVNLLANVKSFNPTAENITTEYPIEKSNSFITNAKSVKNSIFYVSKNKVLMNELNDVPQMMKNKHLKFLDKKFQILLNTEYKNFRSCTIFYDTQCLPIYRDITSFNKIDKELYGGTSALKVNELRTKVDKIDNDCKIP